MTTDERLDRLVERHEALAQSLELLTADIHQMQAENRKRDERIDAIMTGMEKLLLIMESHERRLDRLEGRD